MNIPGIAEMELVQLYARLLPSFYPDHFLYACLFNASFRREMLRASIQNSKEFQNSFKGYWQIFELDIVRRNKSFN